jgi:carboxypeptidase family protein
MSTRLFHGSIVFVLLFVCAGLVFASATGSIAGNVKDPTGAVVPGVKITLTNIATNAQFSSISNERGEFQFLQLPPANYSLVIESPGFKKTVLNALVLACSPGFAAYCVLSKNKPPDRPKPARAVPHLEFLTDHYLLCFSSICRRTTAPYTLPSASTPTPSAPLWSIVVDSISSMKYLTEPS